MTGGPRLLTFGHGTATADEIVALLRAAGVHLVVDIRAAPGSRRHPHVGRDQIERWLPDNGVGYRWEPRMGGWRKVRPDSIDVSLRNKAFAGYAEHMRSPEFLGAADRLLAELAAGGRVTVMCAESAWRRCHRRMVADFLVLARGVSVQHLGHDGQLTAHIATDAARVREDGLLVYDAGQSLL